MHQNNIIKPLNFRAANHDCCERKIAITYYRYNSYYKKNHKKYVMLHKLSYGRYSSDGKNVEPTTKFNLVQKTTE